MFRDPNTDCNGCAFSSVNVVNVWCKATEVFGYDSTVIRKDRCGAWIKWAEYGKETEFGWHIDHDRPVSEEGTDDLYNLQPLHWSNNLGKGDDFPLWNCTIPAG